VFVNRLFQTSAGPLYVEVDYDGVHALLFGEDGRVRKATDVCGDLEKQLEPVLRETFALSEADLLRIAADLREAVAEHDDKEARAFEVVTLLLATFGVWLVGAAAIIVGVVYLLLRIA
jgi:hypothetical protein